MRLSQSARQGQPSGRRPAARG